MLRRSAMRAANQLATAMPKRAASTAAGSGRQGGVLARSAAIFGAANSLGFAISAMTGSHVHIDLLGTGAFAAVAVGTMGAGEIRQRVSAGCIALWAVKLSGFLFYRALQTSHDGRLEDILSTASGAFGFWSISLAWGYMVALPHTLAAASSVAMRSRFGSFLDLAGVGLFAAGLLLETSADYQKWMFKQDARNRGTFCDVGVWQLSQHPNWAGNLIMWTGIWMLNAQNLLAARNGSAWMRLLGGALSPLFLLALFYGQATDNVAKQMALSDARYGGDARYRAWRAETPLVIPTIESVWKALF